MAAQSLKHNIVCVTVSDIIMTDINNPRLVQTCSLFFVFGVFVYFYIYDIILIVSVVCGTWVIYDVIQDRNKETIDSAGKCVLITGCDSGFGLAGAKALRTSGFEVRRVENN